MSKWTVFCLRACVLAAVLLALAVGSSSAEGRLFRLWVWDGELVEIDRSNPSFTGHTIGTMSGDDVEVNPGASDADRFYHLQAIAEALGGWDQLDYLGRRFLEGEDSGDRDIELRYGGDLSEIDGEFYRFVDGALVVPDPLTPHTGCFVYIPSQSFCVEIDPGQSVRKQYDAIEAMIDLGARIVRPGVRLLRLVDGQLEEIDRSNPSFTGHTINTMSGDAVEVNPGASDEDRFYHLQAVAEALGGWDQLDYLGSRTLEGEDSGGGDIELRYGGDLSEIDGKFYRFVDGALIVPDLLTPHTGYFVYLPSQSFYVEIDFDRSVREQYDAIEALIDSGALILHPGRRLLRLVDGQLVEIRHGDFSFTGKSVYTMSGDAVEVNPGASDEDRFYHLQAIAGALGGWDQLDYLGSGTLDGENPGDTDIYYRYGGGLSEIGGTFYRVVNGVLIVPDPPTPHTGYFVYLPSQSFYVEIAPDRSMREQYENIEALIDSGAPILYPGVRLLRLVDGQLVEIGRDDPPVAGFPLRTKSGDVVEVDPDANWYNQLKAIAEALGGWDRINYLGIKTLKGEGPGFTDIIIKYGGKLSRIGEYFYRVVDGALIVPDPLVPHTGHFMQIPSASIWVEIDPDRSVREQFDAIEALIASDALTSRLLRLVDGQLVEIRRSDPSFTGRTVDTMSGDAVEVNPDADWSDQLEAIAEALGGWDQLDFLGSRTLKGEGPDGTDLRIRYGGRISQMSGARFFRVVDGALVEPDPMTPHTGHFLLMSKWGIWVEIDPDRPVREQFDEIDALDRGARILTSPAEHRRLLRLVDGQFVQILRSDPTFTGQEIITMSDDAVELPRYYSSPAVRYNQLKAIAEALGGWDQLDYFNVKILKGEGPGGTDIRVFYGGNIAPLGGYFYRVVDGALIARDLLTRHTGHFVYIPSQSFYVEIDPDRPVREQYDELEALIASDAHISSLFRLVGGQLVRQHISRGFFTGQTIGTMSGNRVEVDPEADWFDQLKAIAKALGGWDQLDYLGRKFLEGEGSGGGDIELRYGGKLSQMGGEFYRFVDGALIVPDPPTPHTGHFVFITSESIYVEIDPDRPVREQYDAVEALIDSGALIMRPTTALEAGSVASLGAPAPNPGNPTLTLSYTIGQSESLPVSLKIYNIVGQVVRALVSDVQGVGSYRAVWDGLNDSGNAVASGTYIAVLTVGDFRASKKLTLAK